MHSTLKFIHKIEHARFLHLLLMFIVAMLFYLLTNLPHGWWILGMSLSISSAIEPGLILVNTKKRVKGTILSLIFLLPLLYALQVNYRLVPIVFIITLIGFNVTSLNFRRYDISVFFNTLAIVFILALTTYIVTPEGPVEVVINRGLSTFIGIVIVLCGDYILLKSYRYSLKLYLAHQMLIYNLFKNIEQEIRDASENKQKNYFLVNKKIRNEINELFQLFARSAQNLKQDLKSTDETIHQVNLFESLVWEMRRVTFALCFSELMLKSSSASYDLIQKHRQLLKKIRSNFITLAR